MAKSLEGYIESSSRYFAQASNPLYAPMYTFVVLRCLDACITVGKVVKAFLMVGCLKAFSLAQCLVARIPVKNVRLL